MAELKKEKKGFFSGIDFSKLNLDDMGYDSGTWNQQNPPRGNSFEGNQGINPKYLQDIRLKKEQERIRIKQLSIVRNDTKKLSKKNYVWLISIGVAVLSYKFAKSNKEFYAFVGFLSPALIMFARSKYEKMMRDEKMKIEREKRNSLAQA
jgi:hypothetical protein